MVDYYIKKFSEVQKEISNFVVKHRESNTAELVNWRYRELTEKNDINALAVDQYHLVGLASYFIRRIIVIGTEFFLADAGHIQVEQDYQGKGIFSRLLLTASNETQRSGVQYLFCIPTPTAMRVLLKQNWERVGNLLLYSKRLSIYSKLLSFIPSEPLCRFLNKLFVSLTTYLSAYPVIRTRDYSFSEITEFNDGCETLCRKVNESIPIMRLRDKAFLTWRFIAKPLKRLNYKVYELHRQDQLRGYIVVLFNPDSKIVTIVDFLADSKDMPVLLKMAIRHLKSFGDYGISQITIGLSQKHLFGKILKSFGFTKSRSKLPVLMKIHNKSDILCSLLLNIKNWHMTYADKDTV